MHHGLQNLQPSATISPRRPLSHPVGPRPGDYPRPSTNPISVNPRLGDFWPIYVHRRLLSRIIGPIPRTIDCTTVDFLPPTATSDHRLLACPADPRSRTSGRYRRLRPGPGTPPNDRGRPPQAPRVRFFLRTSRLRSTTTLSSRPALDTRARTIGLYKSTAFPSPGKIGYCNDRLLQSTSAGPLLFSRCAISSGHAAPRPSPIGFLRST
jgi:hypothetical protein